MEDEAIPAAEANRRFSHVLRAVRNGHRFIVTSHGRPTARIVPVGERDRRIEEAARRVLFSRLEKEPVVDAGRWRRDDLYERPPR